MLKQCCLYGITVTAIIGVTVVSYIYFRLATVASHIPRPQAVLVLGGGKDREPMAAQLAAQNPQLEVWISSGLLPTQANKVFLDEKVSLSRINLDYHATDTVTNFTTIIAKLQAKDIHHIYLVTSDFHMQRAKAIAFWILGSHGIAYTPVIVPSQRISEPSYKVWRDVARSWLWLLTGCTGSDLDST